MSAAEVAAVASRVAAGGVHTWDGSGVEPKYPYVLFYAGSDDFTATREADVSLTSFIDFQTVTVGLTPGQCRAALDVLTAQLRDYRPTVAGRSCSKVSHEGSQPVRKDAELPDRVLFIATNQWQVVSDPL